VVQPAPSEVTHSYKHQPKSSFKVAPNLPWCHICLRTKQRLRKGGNGARQSTPHRVVGYPCRDIDTGVIALGEESFTVVAVLEEEH
jgi:hypothetical protein